MCYSSMRTTKNPILDLSYSFALQIIDIAVQIKRSNYVVGNQLMKSGTSIGANVKEAQNAQSKKDFIAKMYIAFKEAGETEYWLEISRDKKYIDSQTFQNAYSSINQILRLLNSITKGS